MTLRFPKPYADAVARLRVLTGFLLVAAFAWFSHPDVYSLAIGLPISVLGLALRGWAAGHLAKNRDLAIGGPYAFTRNPLYLGTLTVAAGLAIASRSIGLAAVFAAVFVAIYLPVIQLEEQHLRSLFPGYTEYAERVPVLWPKWRRHSCLPRGHSCPRKSFQWKLYVKNQEYQATLGFALGVAWLLWKALR